MGPDAVIFIFWMLSFKSDFSLSFFILIKQLFSSSSLSAIKSGDICLSEVISPGNLDSTLSFIQPSISHDVLYKLNKQSDNIVLTYSFPNFELVHCPCPVLTVASWPAYKFLRRQARWSGIPISLRIFHNWLWPTQSKASSVVNEAEVDIFLEFPCFSYDPTDVGNLIPGSTAFSKSSLYIWKF